MNILPPPLKPNDRLSASWHNELRETVRRLSDGRIDAVGQAALIAAVLESLPSETLVRVRITQVHVPVNGGPGGADAPPYWPSQVLYSYEGIGYPGIVGGPRLPDYGRPVHGDEARIFPAALHSVHYLLRTPAADGEGGVEAFLMMIAGGTKGETVARRRCDTPQPLLGGNAERERIGLKPVLMAETAAIVSGFSGTDTPSDGGTVGGEGRL